jgi:hypothetical protein
MMKVVKLLLMGSMAVGLVWVGLSFRTARKNLVTLNVRNEPLSKVVRSIEWQTWETIVLQAGITSRVTLNVKDMPLEDVLEILGEQSATRWSSVYPIYSSSRTLGQLKTSLRIGGTSSQPGWSALAQQPPQRGAMFVRNGGGRADGLTLSLTNQEIANAARALSRASRSFVIAEDNIPKKVSLLLERTEINAAVEKLAAQVSRKSDHFYVIQKGFEPGRGPGELTASNEEDTSAQRPRRGPAGDKFQNLSEEEKEQKMKEMGLTPEQIQRAAAFATMTPAQRREMRASREASPEIQSQRQSRMLQSIKNTTPEQRVDRFQKRAARRS